MQYAAMEWDHAFSKDWIRWVVVECAGLRQEENGAIQALSPRQDVAYFIREKTAETDAQLFQKIKSSEQLPIEKTQAAGYRAYPWDHAAGQQLIKWAVLRAEPSLRLGREDVAYFLNPETAEQDAEQFALAMNQSERR